MDTGDGSTVLTLSHFATDKRPGWQVVVWCRAFEVNCTEASLA